MRRSQRIAQKRTNHLPSLSAININREIQDLHDLCRQYVFQTCPLDIADIDDLCKKVCKLRKTIDKLLQHILTHSLFMYLLDTERIWNNQRHSRFQSFVIEELDTHYKQITKETAFMIPIMKELHKCLTGF